MALGEDRTVWSLVDIAVGSHRDDQNVAQPLGRFEVTDVPDMHQVEDAVALNHDPASAAVFGDDTREVIAALKRRFPSIQGPELDDICYATQNRQNAVRQLASEGATLKRRR